MGSLVVINIEFYERNRRVYGRYRKYGPDCVADDISSNTKQNEMYD